MPERPTDPARLEGEALRRWYLRSPDEIEQERQVNQAQRDQAFFGDRPSASHEEVGPAAQPARQMAAPDEDVLWVANGRGGYRAARRGAPDFEATLRQTRERDFPDYLPSNSAAAEGGEFLEIGSAENKALKKFYIEKYGFWPKTENGRDYEVSHKRAIADGGKNSLDNIEPIHPRDHRPMHVRQGDSARHGRRSSIARAFGGKVEPSHGGPAVRGFGVIGALANLPGLLLSPPRTNSFENFAADILGVPSMSEYRRAWSAPKWTTPDCPPGHTCI